MGQPQFVHLHVHTDYSLLDGACETSELLDEASRQKMPAVAITDHGNLFAAANFFYEASKRDVKPIIGCEVYVARGSRHDRGEKGNGSNGQERAEGEPGTRGSNHLVLLCESLEGYHNLIKLVSAGFLEGFYYKPRIDYDLLSKHSKGLIALSACLRGPVTEAVVEEKFDLARENAYRLRVIHKCHKRSLELTSDSIETVSDDHWKVKSSSKEDVQYDIVKIKSKCKCFVKCRWCDVCPDLYDCNCPGSVFSSVACKHVHLVHSNIRHDSRRRRHWLLIM
jgi:DNA polymerase III alpha subunit